MSIKKLKRPTPERRWDVLAWILEGTSMCTAVGEINEQLYVSVNEFSSGTQEPQLLTYIYQVLEHFQSLSDNEKLLNTEDKKDINSRLELAQKLLYAQLSTQTKGGIKIPKNVIEFFTAVELLSAENFPKLPHYLKKKEDVAHIAFGYLRVIYTRIRKIENALVKAREGDYIEIDAIQFKALRNFKKSAENRKEGSILFEQGRPGVHAELQIMSKVVNLIKKGNIPLPKEIYLGISKLCCLNCHHMLEAANSVFEQEKIKVTLKFRGAHDATFEKNWLAPKGFEFATKTTRSVEKIELRTLEEKICWSYRKRIELAVPVAKDYNQRPSRSSSDYSLNYLEIFENYKQRLLEVLNIFKKFGFQDSESEKMLNIGEKLCSKEDFTILFDPDHWKNLDEENLTVFMGTLVEEINLTTKSHLVKNEVLNFLNHPIYSPLYGDITKTFANDQHKKTGEMKKQELLDYIIDHENMDKIISAPILNEDNLKLYGFLPNQKDPTVFYEAFVKGAGDCGFIALGTDRVSLVECIKKYSNNYSKRNRLSEEILEAFVNGELLPPKEDTVEWNLLSENLNKAQTLVDELTSAIRDIHQNVPNGLTTDKLITWLKSNIEIIDIEQLQKAHQQVCQFTEKRLLYCCKKKIFEYYVKALRGILWLGYKSALLYAEEKEITLYVWKKKQNISTQLELMESYESLEGNQIIHMLYTNNFTHFNLLFTTALDKKIMLDTSIDVKNTHQLTIEELDVKMEEGSKNTEILPIFNAEKEESSLMRIPTEKLNIQEEMSIEENEPPEYLEELSDSSESSNDNQNLNEEEEGSKSHKKRKI